MAHIIFLLREHLDSSIAGNSKVPIGRRKGEACANSLGSIKRCGEKLWKSWKSMENVYLLRFGDQILKRFVSLSASSNRPAACPRPAFWGHLPGRFRSHWGLPYIRRMWQCSATKMGYHYIYICALYIYIYHWYHDKSTWRLLSQGWQKDRLLAGNI